MEGWRGVSTCVFGYCGRVMEKKRGIYGEREDTHSYANREPDMVLRLWAPQTVQIFEL